MLRMARCLIGCLMVVSCGDGGFVHGSGAGGGGGKGGKGGRPGDGGSGWVDAEPATKKPPAKKKRHKQQSRRSSGR